MPLNCLPACRPACLPGQHTHTHTLSFRGTPTRTALRDHDVPIFHPVSGLLGQRSLEHRCEVRHQRRGIFQAKQQLQTHSSNEENQKGTKPEKETAEAHQSVVRDLFFQETTPRNGSRKRTSQLISQQEASKSPTAVMPALAPSKKRPAASPRLVATVGNVAPPPSDD